MGAHQNISWGDVTVGLQGACSSEGNISRGPILCQRGFRENTKFLGNRETEYFRRGLDDPAGPSHESESLEVEGVGEGAVCGAVSSGSVYDTVAPG